MAISKVSDNILVVDDVIDTVEVIQRNLSAQGYSVFTSSSVEEALDILESIQIDLVVTDWKMPNISGIELIKHLRDNYNETKVMMITGYATIEGAVTAIKTGADEYLSKPFTDEELLLAVKKVLMEKKAHHSFKVDIEDYKRFSKYGLIGASDPMKKIYSMIIKVASSSANVLISGESGTGKELVARAIHYNSERSSAPFVPVNCGGIPENLLESELFGHLKGSFTDARETRAGFFQTADGGTIFLDEISETSTAMQVKLLRVLQEKEVCMVGANRSSKVDVRILAATNKDLSELVKNGRFREDLFFRLNVINISLPPLRERDDDILLLVNHFAQKYSKEYDKISKEFTEHAIDVLRKYYWPGNVRELENLIQNVIVMSDDNLIDATDFPSHLRYSIQKGNGFTKTLNEIEVEYIKNVLASVKGNKTQAAKILAIDRKTLREKMK